MTYTFGDDDVEDAYVEGNVPDPEHVARRLHELAAYLDALAGRGGAAPFDDLTPNERTLAASVGDVIAEWIATHEPDDAAALAAELHAVRRYWTRNALARWEDLAPEERELAVELMRHVVEWLQREGTE